MLVVLHEFAAVLKRFFVGALNADQLGHEHQVDVSGLGIWTNQIYQFLFNHLDIRDLKH